MTPPIFDASTDPASPEGAASLGNAASDFKAKWGPGGAAYDLNERQGAQTYFLDLCALLDVPAPGSQDGYVFEKQTLVLGQNRGFTDVFYKNRFAWENKAPGKSLDTALKQLLNYSLALDNPPLLIVCDRLEIRIHTQFNGHPSVVHTVKLADITHPAQQQLLRRVWLSPESFKPAVTNRDITEKAAKSFATLADNLRKRGPQTAPENAQYAEQIAHFLTQTLFCFFAEDVGLLPGRMFERLVGNRQINSLQLTTTLQNLFETMRAGGPFGADNIPWFNGGLFKNVHVPKLEIIDITELRNAASLNWSAIDVSIFGTLFERGLDPTKRSQLGAHYTDPATIERIISPVVRRPLLQKWELVSQSIRRTLAKSSKKNDTHYRQAHGQYVAYLQSLADFKILDPACGSGNFLFLGLKALKDIEHQVITQAELLGLERPVDLCTSPANMLGIELNEYAAELARVTVWIGELQWRMEHGYPFKDNPILEPLDCIEHRDALVTRVQPNSVRTEPISVRTEPVEVPHYIEADWPQASVVIGNPPFLGGKKFVTEFGEQYANALRTVFAGRVPGLADLVTYWFDKASAQIMSNKLSAAGFVATNSIRDGFSRFVLQQVNTQTPIFTAWSDEPWVNDGANVRVSLIAFSPFVDGRILNDVAVDAISADLSAASIEIADLTTARTLKSNKNVAFQGTTRSGPFDISGELARQWLSLPNPHQKSNADVVRPWSNGLDITRRSSDTWIIDFGVSINKFDASLYESPFNHCTTHVLPTRIKNRNPRLVEQYWHYDGVRVGMRSAIAPLQRYIATTITAKYRTFVWFHPSKLPDATLVAIARSDDATFGILHSRMHELWSLGCGSTLEDRPRYLPGVIFETFPFPPGLTPLDTAHQRTETLACGAVIPALASDATPALRSTATAIAQAAKRLDDLRKNWLNPPEWTRRVPEVIPLGMASSPYPDRILPRDNLPEQDAAALQKRTLTNLYNLRQSGKIQWLENVHQQLDAAVAAAYGWADYSPDLPDEEILKCLLALNLARAGAAARAGAGNTVATAA